MFNRGEPLCKLLEREVLEHIFYEVGVCLAFCILLGFRQVVKCNLDGLLYAILDLQLKPNKLLALLVLLGVEHQKVVTAAEHEDVHCHHQVMLLLVE